MCMGLKKRGECACDVCEWVERELDERAVRCEEGS